LAARSGVRASQTQSRCAGASDAQWAARAGLVRRLGTSTGVDGSGGEPGAALVATTGNDGSPGTRAHAQPETVRLGAAPVVRLERALAHWRAPGSDWAIQDGQKHVEWALAEEPAPVMSWGLADATQRDATAQRYGPLARWVKRRATAAGSRPTADRTAAARPALRPSLPVHPCGERTTRREHARFTRRLWTAPCSQPSDVVTVTARTILRESSRQPVCALANRMAAASPTCGCTCGVRPPPALFTGCGQLCGRRVHALRVRTTGLSTIASCRDEGWWLRCLIWTQ